MKQDEATLNKIAEEFKKADLPVPLTVKKTTKEERLILHVFLDHVYTQVLPHVEHVIQELESFEGVPDEWTGKISHDIEAVRDSIKKMFNNWASIIESLPDTDELDHLIARLNEEVEKANAISLAALQKDKEKE